MIKAVIFDMDGLMFDTEALAKEAWLQVGAKLGRPITEAHIARVRGSTPAASAAVFREIFGADFDYPKAKAMRNAIVEEVIDRQGVPIKRGLVGLLEQLDRHGLKAAVASSSPRRTVEKYLALAGVSRYFNCVVGAEDVTRSKPAPDAFLLAARRLQIPPEACLALEDSGNGLQGAHRAGMKVICIPDIAPPSKECLSLASKVFPDLTYVFDWIMTQP